MALKRHPVAASNALDPILRIPLDKALVARLRATYERVRTSDVRLATIFYDKLFAVAPHLRPMFKGDLELQRHKLIQAMDAVVMNFENPEANSAMLSALGQRHASYGAKPEHYELVVDLLIESMSTLLGPETDPKELAEWRTALQLVSQQMIAATTNPPPHPAVITTQRTDRQQAEDRS